MPVIIATLRGVSTVSNILKFPASVGIVTVSSDVATDNEMRISYIDAINRDLAAIHGECNCDVTGYLDSISQFVMSLARQGLEAGELSDLDSGIDNLFMVEE